LQTFWITPFKKTPMKKRPEHRKSGGEKKLREIFWRSGTRFEGGGKRTIDGKKKVIVSFQKGRVGSEGKGVGDVGEVNTHRRR